ncbi:hypothetical protein ACFX14_036123 [Malus domestica]
MVVRMVSTQEMEDSFIKESPLTQGGQFSSHSTGSYGFVGQYNKSNTKDPSGGSFTQANIPQQFQSHRHNGNNGGFQNGGFNGSRYNSRPRFNEGFYSRNTGNNDFSGSNGSNGK